MQRLIELDRWLFGAINQGWQFPLLDTLTPWLSLTIPLLPILFLVIWLLAARHPKRWQILIGLLILLLFTDFAVSHLLRPWLGRPRPFVVTEGAHVWLSGTWLVVNKGLMSTLSVDGFPSSHASNAMGAAVFLLFFLPRAGVAIALLAVMVGLSRVYMGLHYPGDVLAGFAWGAGWGWLLGRLARRHGEALQEKVVNWRPSQLLFIGLATVLLLTLIAAVPGLGGEWREVFEEYQGAAVRLLQGQWLIVPGSGRALAMTPLAVLGGIWLNWLPAAWGAGLMALLNAVLLWWLVIQSRLLLGQDFKGNAWFWGSLWAAGGAMAACWYGFTGLWALAAVVIGLRLIRDGRTVWAACCWGLAAALQMSCLALLIPLILRGRWRAAIGMLISAAGFFLLPDMLFPQSGGGWYCLDHISHNLIHLSWMNGYVSNLASGDPVWLSPEIVSRLSWVWQDAVVSLWPDFLPLSASTVAHLVVPGLLFAVGFLIAAPMMAPSAPWPLAAGAALLWGMAFWPGRSPADYPAIILPAMAAASVASPEQYASETGKRVFTLIRLTVAIVMVLALSNGLGDVIGRQAHLWVPQTWYPLAVLLMLWIGAVVKHGHSPAGHGRESVSASAGDWPWPRRVWLLAVVLLLVVCLESLRWERAYGQFAKLGQKLTTVVADYARRNAGSLPAEGPIEIFGALRSQSFASWLPEPLAAGADDRPSRQEVAYNIDEASQNDFRALLFFAGPGARLGGGNPAWPSDKMPAIKNTALPRSAARLILLGEGKKPSNRNSSSGTGACLFPGICWEQSLPSAQNFDIQRAITVAGVAPCRARMDDGVHLGQVREGGCAIPWGGAARLVENYEVLTGNVKLCPKMPEAKPGYTAIVQGGMTGKYGFQRPCLVSREGHKLLGKLHLNACHAAEDGKERSHADYWLLGPCTDKD